MNYGCKFFPAKVTNVCNNLIVDAILEDGQLVSAFCGAVNVAKLCRPNTHILLKKTTISSRIIKYNVAFVKTPDGTIFAEPKYNQNLFKEAFDKGIIEEFRNYTNCRPLRERTKTNILDFELTSPNGEKAYVFIASIYDKQGVHAVFPNSVNFFELKMFEEMKKWRDKGAETYVFIIVPREDCITTKFTWNLNPRAAAALFDAAQDGLNFLCYSCKLTQHAVELDKKMEILY